MGKNATNKVLHSTFTSQCEVPGKAPGESGHTRRFWTCTFWVQNSYHVTIRSSSHVLLNIVKYQICVWKHYHKTLLLESPIWSFRPCQNPLYGQSHPAIIVCMVNQTPIRIPCMVSQTLGSNPVRIPCLVSQTLSESPVLSVIPVSQSPGWSVRPC